MANKTEIVTVLIGPPCTGKTTYLNSMDYDFVISSDSIVEILCRRAGLKYHDFFQLPSNSPMKASHNEIFNQLIIESFVFNHVVWDLTNLTNKARKKIFEHYPQVTFKAVIFDFVGMEKRVLELNKQRYQQQGKWVDEKVMQSMFERFEPVEASEGFNDVEVVKISEWLELI